MKTIQAALCSIAVAMWASASVSADEFGIVRFEDTPGPQRLAMSTFVGSGVFRETATRAKDDTGVLWDFSVSESVKGADVGQVLQVYLPDRFLTNAPAPVTPSVNWQDGFRAVAGETYHVILMLRSDAVLYLAQATPDAEWTDFKLSLVAQPEERMPMGRSGDESGEADQDQVMIERLKKAREDYRSGLLAKEDYHIIVLESQSYFTTNAHPLLAAPQTNTPPPAVATNVEAETEAPAAP